MSVRSGFALAILLAVTFTVYSASLWAPFVYDDAHFIVKNPVVNFQRPISLHGVRSMTLFTYRINYLFGGDDPLGYHIVNLALHCMNGLLVYSVVRLLAWSDLPALFAAGLFLLHPLQTEAVIYASGRTELLAAFFVLLSMLYYLRERPHVAFVFFGLAVMSKESAIVLPLAIMAYELIRRRVPHWTVFVGLLSSIPAVMLGYRTLEHADRSWFAHLFIQSANFAHYLTMLILPFGLTIDHDPEIYPLVIGAALALTFCGALVAAWWMRGGYPLVSFAVLWVAAFVLPRFALNVPEFQSEHHWYAAMFGISLIFAQFFTKETLHESNF